jgi:predicted nuclease of restriction endonuclease-like (RecB) superfamily
MKRGRSNELGRAYTTLVSDVSAVLEAGRTSAVWTLNTIMSAVYWEIGRRIVQFEQAGQHRADYGERVIEHLSIDLKKRFGGGFGRATLFQIRAFYLAYNRKVQTLFGQLAGTHESKDMQIVQTLSGQFDLSYLRALKQVFPLPWSHYIRLVSIREVSAREFYETEALRNGWSVRQLDRQIATRFYERTALSKNKAAMLQKARLKQPADLITPEQAIKDPYILEFLQLKDEYSETDLEDELIRRLEDFLMELGGDFAFVGRQKRLRVGDEWYRIDLLFFHRRLHCLVVIDLKVGKFTHAEAGQMHLYLNYAREHWTNPDENPPVGLILCSQKDSAVVKYALEGLPNKVMASEYKLALPDEKLLAAEIDKAREFIEKRIN